MTSINAMRFNRYEGVCLCDESISSYDGMRLNVSDKMQSCIPAVITEKYGVVGALGTTGSCSFGDRIKKGLREKLSILYQQELEKNGKPPEKFLTLDEIAPLIFDIIVDGKTEMISEQFMGCYGFNLAEFLEGCYERDGKKIEIKDKETNQELSALLNWKYEQAEISHIFMNAVLFAGYDEECGFCIYHYDLRGGYWHKVHHFYFAEGSGRHSVDPAIYPFAEKLLLKNRRTEVDRVMGLMAFIHSLNKAADHEIGVGGYPSIALINGKKPHEKRFREINDRRALLSSQIMRALDHSFIDYPAAKHLIDRLIFQNADFDEIYTDLFEKNKSARALTRLLRGYKILPYHHDIVD